MHQHSLKKKGALANKNADSTSRHLHANSEHDHDKVHVCGLRKATPVRIWVFRPDYYVHNIARRHAHVVMATCIPDSPEWCVHTRRRGHPQERPHHTTPRRQIEKDWHAPPVASSTTRSFPEKSRNQAPTPPSTYLPDGKHLTDD